MKLKKSSVPSGGAAIAERFRIDGDSGASKSAAAPSKVAATTVFIFGLIAFGIMAAIVGMEYVDWSLTSLQ